MTEPTDEGEDTIGVAALPDIHSRVYAFGVPPDIGEDEEALSGFIEGVTDLFEKADVVVFDREMDANTADDAIEVHKLAEVDIRDIVEAKDD